MFGSIEKKAEKLDKLGQAKKLNKIVPFLGNKEPAVRAAAVSALQYIDSDESLNALVRMIHDRDLNVRMNVIKSMIAIKRPAAAEHIRHAYGSTSEPEFVDACKKALTTFVDLQKGV